MDDGASAGGRARIILSDQIVMANAVKLAWHCRVPDGLSMGILCSRTIWHRCGLELS